jgi:hypothetical protein
MAKVDPPTQHFPPNAATGIWDATIAHYLKWITIWLCLLSLVGILVLWRVW